MRPTIPAAGPAWDLSTEYADTDDPAPDADLEDLAPLLDEFDRRNRILATCIPMLSDPSTATTAVERDAAIAAARETHVLRENAARLLGSAAVYDNCRLAALELRGRLEPPQVRFSDAPEPLSQFLDLATQPWIDAYLDDDRTRASAFAVAHSRRPGHAILELEQERPRRRSKTWRSTYCVPDVAARGVAGSAAYCGAAMRGGALALLLLFAVAASAQSPTTDGDVDAETPAGPIDAAAPGSPEGIASGGWDDPTLGPADAAVTLFEFTDYSCPYSRDNAADVLAFAEEHPDLRVVFKLLPLQGDASVTAALAAVAAARQPGWPEFHAALMGSRPGADIDDAIREAATAAGMDLARLERDMERDEAAAVVERTRELAEHVGVRSTPRYLAGDMDLGNWIPRQVLGALLSRAVGGGVEAQLELGDALYDHLGLFSRPFASQAIDLYTEVIRLDPENTAAYIKRSQALTYIQDFDRAIADCGEAIRLDPDNASAYAARARVRRRLDDLEGAVEDYGEAIRLDPDNSEKLLMEIDGLRETGTVETYTDLIRRDPSNAAAYFLRGRLRFSDRYSSLGTVALAQINEDTDNLVLAEAMADFGEVIRLVPNNVVAHFWRGVIRERQGDYDGSAHDFTDMIRHRPGNAWGYYHRGVVRRKKDDLVGAIEDFDEGVRLGGPSNQGLYYNPNPSDDGDESWGRRWIHYGRGVARQEQDDQDGAIEDFTEAIRLNPNFPGAYRSRGVSWQAKGDQQRKVEDFASDHYWRGVSWTWRNDHHRAIEEFDAAIRLDPHNEAAYGDRAWSRLQTGNHHGAIKDYGEAIRLNPAKPFWYIGRGDLREGTGDRDGALADYDEAIRLDPSNAAVYHSRGVLRAGAGDHDGALADYDEAIRLDPGAQEAYGSWYFDRGVSRYETGDYDGAIADFGEVIRIRSWGDATAYYARGLSRAEASDHDGALADFDEAIRLDPDYVAAYYNRGVLRHEAGDHDGALADFGEVVRLDPDNALAYNNRGVSRRATGDHDGALDDFGEAIRLDPDNAPAYFNRGVSRQKAGDHDGAMADFGEVVRLDPDDADAYYNRGVSRRATGDHDGALDDFGEAIRLDPDYVAAYYNRGESRVETGDHDGAVEDYAVAVRLDPDDAWPHNSLAWILAVGPSNVRDGERAVRLSRKALALEDDAFIRDTLAAALVATGELDAAVDEYEAAIRQDPALVDDYGDILISEGYALTASAGYDAAMRAALHTYVRSECQLLSAEDRRLYRRGASCADEGE